MGIRSCLEILLGIIIFILIALGIGAFFVGIEDEGGFQPEPPTIAFSTATPFDPTVPPPPTLTPLPTRTLAPSSTPFPTFTPSPIASPTATATPAEAAAEAQVGDNRGEIPLGGGELWTYQGQVGEVLTISVFADEPGNEFTTSERVDMGLLDTYLYFYGTSGILLAEADDIDPGVITDSVIEGFVLAADGAYTIEVRSWNDTNGGAYTLVIESSLAPNIEAEEAEEDASEEPQPTAELEETEEAEEEVESAEPTPLLATQIQLTRSAQTPMATPAATATP